MLDCNRCGKYTVAWKLSWYNKENICMECAEKEEARSDFDKAKAAVKEQDALGNFEYEGIGL